MSRFPRLLILSALVVGAALAGCRRDDSLYRPVDDSGARVEDPSVPESSSGAEEQVREGQRAEEEDKDDDQP